MGISRDKAHKRRLTGGRVKRIRSKRKFELGRQPSNTKLGDKKVTRVRVRGGHYKFRAIRLDHGNFNWAGEAVSRKTRILKVVYNATSNELVRTNTLVKGAIVQIDSAPFKQWYQKFYNVALGKLKEGEDSKAPRDLAKDEKKKSTLRSYKKERKLAKLKSKKEAAAGLKGIEKKSTAQKRAEAIEKKAAAGKKVAAAAAKKAAAGAKKGAAEKKPAAAGDKTADKGKAATEKKPAAGKKEAAGAKKGAADKKPATEKKPAGKAATEKKPAAGKKEAAGAKKGAADKKPATEKKPAAEKKPADKKPVEKKPVDKIADDRNPDQNEATTEAKKPKVEKKEGDLSDKLKNKLSQRNRIRVLETQLGDQFRTGRLYARISSRPGQSGRADGYILEGEELAFYIKKIHSKKKK